MFNQNHFYTLYKYELFFQMWIDSVIEYDIIVETLTGAEIEVTVTDDDTIGYIKAHIQKYEGK